MPRGRVEILIYFFIIIFFRDGNFICREVADVRLTLLSRKPAAAKSHLILGCFVI